ncbi:MAG: GNVR domain-containing protein [Salinibacter sp.]
MPAYPPPEDEITLSELLLQLTRGRGLIILSLVGFGLLGTLYAVSQSSKYTASSKVVREAQGDGGGGGGLPGGLPSISGLGISLGGGGGGGLTPASYPEIATSREVRLAVARDTFYFPSTGRRTTFIDHVNQPTGPLGHALRFTVYLPWTIKGYLGDLIRGSPTRPIETDTTGTLIYPTEEEENAIQALGNMISASVSQSGALESGSGLMSISTTASDPTLAAKLNERVIHHLRSRVREIRTQTTRENLKYVKKRFKEAQEELDAAEDQLSQFLERNRSVLTGGGAPQLEFRRDRLRREVSFKEQLYSQLQKQVTQTRIQLQKEQPVVTIAERPVPPSQPSAPNRTLTVVLSLFLGGLFGVGGVFLRSALEGDGDDEQEERLQEIRESMTLEGIAEGVKQEVGLDQRDRHG